MIMKAAKAFQLAIAMNYYGSNLFTGGGCHHLRSFGHCRRGHQARDCRRGAIDKVQKVRSPHLGEAVPDRNSPVPTSCSGPAERDPRPGRTKLKEAMWAQG
ncbi:hypothetical protein CN059_27275 [Sinorhizobium medicae]|nr:hypothetical protein CN059_27275 [Sinorhizobium medicae]